MASKSHTVKMFLRTRHFDVIFLSDNNVLNFLYAENMLTFKGCSVCGIWAGILATIISLFFKILNVLYWIFLLYLL